MIYVVFCVMYKMKINHNISSNEEIGLWSEKIICDILNISFNTRRSYLTYKNYPCEIEKDLYKTLSLALHKLKINKHLGNENKYYDFQTIIGEQVSLKTNIRSFKVCPQKIGQTTLNALNKHFCEDFTKEEFKKKIINNTLFIIREYLKYTFCCDYLINIKYDTGKVFLFKRSFEIILEFCIFKFTKKLEDWNESNTIKIKIGEIFVSIAEIQIHNNRNCIKCRFNFETILKLIRNNTITGITLEEFELEHKYNIRVIK